MEEITGGQLLRRALGRHRKRLALGVFWLSLHQTTEAAVPVTIGIFVDRAVSTGRLEPLLWCVLMMAGLFAVLSTQCKDQPVGRPKPQSQKRLRGTTATVRLLA